MEYFPHDVGLLGDDKVRLIKGEFGSVGLLTYLYLLESIYGDNGYYKTWTDDVCILVADAVGCGCNFRAMAEIVKGCVRRSLFDERVLDVSGVLTSAGIQRRYIRAASQRENIAIIDEYWLLDVDDRNDVPAGILKKIAFKSLSTLGNPDKKPGNPDKTQRNPLKESKEKERKEKNKDIVFSHEITRTKEWNDFAAMRMQKKKPLNDRSVAMAVSKLEELAPGNTEKQKAILNQSTYHCWDGLFPLKEEDNHAFNAGAAAKDAGGHPGTDRPKYGDVL